MPRKKFVRHVGHLPRIQCVWLPRILTHRKRHGVLKFNSLWYHISSERFTTSIQIPLICNYTTVVTPSVLRLACPENYLKSELSGCFLFLQLFTYFCNWLRIMRDAGLPPCCKWNPRSSGMLRSVNCNSSPFRDKISVKVSRARQAKENGGAVG